MQVPRSFDIDELDVPDETMYEVERVLRYRKQKKKNRTVREFITVWEGFTLEDASWEPEENFSDLA